MALTDAQRADVYFFCGWPQRYVQVNTALEMALNAIALKPAQEALLGNSLTSNPPGLLAQARQLYDVTIPAAYKRLKAIKVGSIELSGPGELRELSRQGQRLVGAICSTLGVERDADVFSPGSGGRWPARNSVFAQSSMGGNWIGK